MKRKFILLQMLLLVVSTAIAQTGIKEYVQQNTHQILTDNLDTLYDADLEKFGEAIGNKRIVMLGEQSHGDAATFLMKGRLIKYLHEKKGFNILAFESDFISITGGWDKLPKNKLEIDSFLKRNIFQLWSYCHACNNLFYNYINTTQNTLSPLQIAGFDCQLHGMYAFMNLKTDLKAIFLKLSYAEKIKKETDTVLKYVNILFRGINDNKNQYAATKKALEFILESDKSHHELSEWSLMILKNLLAQSSNMNAMNPSNTNNYYFRDKQMAENIEWLAKQKYPNEKMIIWAHNVHIAKNYGYDYANTEEKNYMMGDFLYTKPSLSKEMYVLGFTSFEGETGWVNLSKHNRIIKKPLKNSFEKWVDKKYNFAFSDFAKYNKDNAQHPEAFSMKGSLVNHSHISQKSYWTKIFDGVFFIRNMYGCAPATLR